MSNSSIAAQITKVIQNYAVGLEDSLQALSKKEAANCAKDLNSASSVFEPTGHTATPYSKSWTSKQDGMGYTTYCKIPGLPHLLENGHEVISHGRSAGHANGTTHIGPVANHYVLDFEEEAKKLVSK